MTNYTTGANVLIAISNLIIDFFLWSWAARIQDVFSPQLILQNEVWHRLFFSYILSPCQVPKEHLPSIKKAYLIYFCFFVFINSTYLHVFATKAASVTSQLTFKYISDPLESLISISSKTQNKYI